jgi:Zn-dependent membrane protease YugP
VVVRIPQRQRRRPGVRVLLVVLLVIGSLLLAALLAGIFLANLKFFIWIGIIGLVIWGIYMLVTRPWRYS